MLHQNAMQRQRQRSIVSIVIFFLPSYCRAFRRVIKSHVNNNKRIESNAEDEKQRKQIP